MVKSKILKENIIFIALLTIILITITTLGLTLSAFSQSSIVEGSVTFAISGQKGKIDLDGAKVNAYDTGDNNFTVFTILPQEGYSVVSSLNFSTIKSDGSPTTNVLDIDLEPILVSGSGTATQGAFTYAIENSIGTLIINNALFLGQISDIFDFNCLKIVGNATPITYTISFNPNGGTLTPTQDNEVPTLTQSGSVYNLTASYNSFYLISNYIDTITYSNRTFLGWAVGSSSSPVVYTNNTTLSNLTTTAGTTITLYAKWQNLPVSSTVTLDNQSATTAGTASVLSISGYPMPTITVPTKTGYLFDGYYTSANGVGTKYYNSTGQSAHDCDFTTAKTLYANWTPITYTITFDANSTAGGTGTMADITATYNIATQLPANTFTSTNNRVFAGWIIDYSTMSITAKYGTTSTPTNVVYPSTVLANQDYVLNLTTVNERTLIFTAKWVVTQGTQYNITYKNCEGLNISDNYSHYTGGQNLILPDDVNTIFTNAPSYMNTYGYSIEGFYTDANLTAINKVTNISDQDSGDKTFYISWQIADATKASNLFYYSVSNNEVTLQNGSSSALKVSLTSLFVPNYIDGKPVTIIGSAAFSGRTNLTSILIPSSVTSIGGSAFYNCKALTFLYYNVPNYASAYNNSAFGNAGINGDGINVVFGDSVTTIPAYLFYTGSNSFPKVVSVTMGSNVASIGYNAFYACGINTVNYTGSLEDWLGITFNGADSTPLRYRGNLYLNYSNGVGTELTSISASDWGNITQIHSYALYKSRLTSITLSNNITNIGAYAFSSCTMLSTLNVGNGDLSIDTYAFSGCTGLSTLTISCNSGAIGANAFSDCTGLSTLTISCNSSTIGANAFSGCTSLTAVTIGNGVTSMGTNAFNNCTALTRINYNATSCANFDINSSGAFSNVGNNSAGVEVVIGDNVQSIPQCIFRASNNIVSLTIGSGVQTIGGYAFNGCTYLTTLNYNAANCGAVSQSYAPFKSIGKNGNGVNVVIGDDVQSIPAYLFYNNDYSTVPKIISVVIGDNVESIGDYAFYNYNSGTSYTYLTTLTIGESVTSIGKNAFYYQGALTTINYNAINCADLTNSDDYRIFRDAGKNSGSINVVIGENVQHIPANLFRSYDANNGPPKIVSVTMGSSVTSVGSNAFSYCSTISRVNYTGNIEGWAGITFGTSTSNPLCFGASFYINYDCSNGTGTQLTTITANDWGNASQINSYAFYGYTSLTNVVMSDNITSIGSYPFSGCTNLTTVTIGSGVTTMGTYAFSGGYFTRINYNATNCTTLGNNADNVNNYVFYSTGSLGDGLEIVIGDNVQSIPAYLFCPYNGGNSNSSSYYPRIVSLTIGSGVQSIGISAFRFLYNVTTINYNAVNCVDTTSTGNQFCDVGKNASGINLTIGNNVTRIPAYLFYAYSNNYSSYSPYNKVISVTMGTNVQSIGAYAFSNCQITTVNYTGNLENWVNIAFGGAYSAPFYTNGANLYINYFNGSGTEITTITANDLGNATQISPYAFYNYQNLATIAIPNSVENIGGSAFRGCTNLLSLTIGSGVQTIGTYAFYGCTALTSINYNAVSCTDIGNNNYVFYNAGINGNGIDVEIGSSVQHIPAYLFYPYSGYEPKIVSLTIGEGVTSIGNYAFCNCKLLTRIEYNAIACENLIGGTNNKCNYVFSKAGQDGNGIDIIVGDNVQSIPEYLFYPYFGTSGYSPKIISIVIGNSVQTIGTYAFCNYDSSTNNYLTSLTIGENVVTIGNGAFRNNAALTSVVIPDSVETIGASAFSSCSNLTTLTIGSNVSNIGANAFYNCTYITKINYNAIACSDLASNNDTFYYAGKNGAGINIIIGHTVQSIPAYLFCPHGSSYCPKIVSVSIGSNVTSIGNYAFYYCSTLKTVYNYSALNIVKNNSSYGYVAYYADAVYTNANAVIQGGVIYQDNTYAKAIGFDGSTNTITLHNDCTEIGDGAFAYYDTITSINIPSTLTTIGVSAFYNCSALVSVTDLSGVISIGANAFYGCASLTSLAFNNNVVSIGANAFYGCSNLATISYISGVNTIGASAFYGCLSLSAIDFGTSLTTIGQQAFYGCSNLTSLTIPSTVTNIGNSAFYGVTKLETINFNASSMNNLASGNNIFYNAGKSTNGISVTIGASVGSIPAYLFYPNSNVTYSPKITSIIFASGSTCISIGDYAFENLDISSIIIPASVQILGAYAFYNCLDLVTITFASSSACTSIGSNAFQNSGAATITIPSSVENIGDSAFSNMSALATLIFENGSVCTSIGDYAFAGTGITAITIPSMVTSIGNYAFYNCLDLATITFASGSACTSIGNYAFAGTDIATIAIPSAVTQIGKYAFANCENLVAASFADITGWYITAIKDAASGLDVTLDNVATNAAYLLFDYCLCYWYKATV